MTEFDTYREMKNAGASPQEVWCAAERDGVSRIEAIRLLRAIFGFDLEQAKEVMVRADAAESLDEHQRRLAKSIDGASKGGRE